MSGHCLDLLAELQTASRGLEGSKALEMADDVEKFVTPSIILLQCLTTTQCYEAHRQQSKGMGVMEFSQEFCFSRANQ
jgi:hypothetical protein